MFCTFEYNNASQGRGSDEPKNPAQLSFEENTANWREEFAF